MIAFRYDKTLEGLLTVVFDAYYWKTFPDKLLAENEPEPMFTTRLQTVVTDIEKSKRVWSALEKKIGKNLCNMLLHVWMSEEQGSDELLYRYIRKAFDNPFSYVANFADTDVIEANQLAKKVGKEAEHLRQFVRFQKAADGTYFAPVAPKYNALPFSIDFFKDRFADQQWLIYDTKRHYGFYYDLREAKEVTLQDDEHLLSGKLNDALMAEDEKLFQQLWKSYLQKLTIKERLNLKLQRQHMPRRFWRYLTEKQ